MTPRLFLIAALIAFPSFAQTPADISAAKAKYKSSPSETNRIAYVHALLRMHEKLMPLQNGPTDANFRAVDAALTKVPAPAKSDSAALTKLRVGKWRSPRHDYLYRRDGTSTMLPVDDANTPGDNWKIKGNKFISDETGAYTIVLLDAHDFIYFASDGTVFYEKRISK